MNGSGAPAADTPEGGHDGALRVLRSGGLVAAATETLVGVLADASRAEALERITLLKGRPARRPFSLLIPDVASLSSVAADISPGLERAVLRLWPGPVTVVLPGRTDLQPALLADDGTVAVRVAGDSPAADLCRAFGGPLTATSANRSGRPAVADTAELDPEFVRGLDLVLAGRSSSGLPSTIVAVRGEDWHLIREGAVSLREIQEALE